MQIPPAAPPGDTGVRLTFGPARLDGPVGDPEVTDAGFETTMGVAADTLDDHLGYRRANS
ncbi:hypothetical protein [Frankia gtarii]|uniref:hypothetical protein n=1 Tax=Frankia gtarii TaxID=2950102 RepID=UPI0021C00B51|nr:hypothetical protein [Frankia gtarii]